MSETGPSSVEISPDGRRLFVRRPDGSVVAAPAPWLYDNAAGAFDEKSGHRLKSALALSNAQEIQEARTEDGSILVTFAPGRERGRVPLGLLAPAERPAPLERRLWTTTDGLPQAEPIGMDAYLADDASLRTALEQVLRAGLVFLSGAGTEPRTVERAVARFGYVRETNYGRVFDVRDEPAASHLAYTARGLDLHTDNPYRDPVPTLQILHVLEAAPEGGESQFADGFAHAAALRAAAPDRFEVLSATPVEFGYIGPAGERYAAQAPVIETSVGVEVTAVRLNHRALRAPPLEGAEAWYEAYLDFYKRVHAPTARLERLLEPGEIVIFDNRRVLHGRSPYRSGMGRRWLQGCYAEVDGLRATLSRLRNGAAGRR